MTDFYDIFICYVKNNSDWVLRFKDALKTEVERVLQSTVEILCEPIEDLFCEKQACEIVNFLECCGVCVPVFTPEFFESEICKGTFDKFLAMQNFSEEAGIIAPIMHKHCELDANFSASEYIDFAETEGNANKFNDKVQELANNLAPPILKFRKRIPKTLIQTWDAIIEENPEDANAFYYRGLVYNVLREDAKALADFNKAIEFAPDFALPYICRGDIYRWTNEYHKAISDYSRVIELDAQNPDAFHNRGLAYANINEHTKAIADFTQAIEIEPTNSIAYYNRGNAYRNLYQFAEAIADYTKSIGLDPNYILAYNNRGLAYRKLQQRSEALDDFTRAIEIAQELGFLNFDAASEPKENICNKDGQNQEECLSSCYFAFNNRANLYSDIEEYAKAIEDYSKAIAINPNDAEIFYNRGLALNKVGEFAMAVADFKKALEFEPNDVYTYCGLGIAYNNLKEYELAIRCYEKGLKISPKENIILYNCACVYSLMLDIVESPDDKEMLAKKAIEHLRLAIKYGFHNRELIRTDTDLDNIRKRPDFLTL